MIKHWWYELAHKFPNVETDEFVVMPDHFHGIIILTQGTHTGAPLSEIVQWFKTMTTNAYIRGVKLAGWLPFEGKLWQRNYYEHIVRNMTDMERIQKYIQNNPSSWEHDR